MLGTDICQMYSLLDGYLVLKNQCLYEHQGGRVPDLCLSHVKLIQPVMNNIQLQMECVELFWYSFPTGRGLRGTNINPGHVNHDVHIDIDSSIQDTHPARNTSDICQFQA